MSLPAGMMADRSGVKRTLVLGQVVIAAGLIAVSTSGSFGVLIVLMALAGFGYGMVAILLVIAVLIALSIVCIGFGNPFRYP